MGDKVLLDAAVAATAVPAAHRNAINALNVFPVPDGNNGTNVFLTMRAAVEAGRLTLARGAGAGDNSGVPLSLVIRGFAGAIADRETIDGRNLLPVRHRRRVSAGRGRWRASRS